MKRWRTLRMARLSIPSMDWREQSHHTAMSAQVSGRYGRGDRRRLDLGGGELCVEGFAELAEPAGGFATGSFALADAGFFQGQGAGFGGAFGAVEAGDAKEAEAGLSADRDSAILCRSMSKASS
jgi:hypothetical protein